MQENLIETDGVKYAEKRGWLVYKWSSPGNAGVLDRLHFKNGLSFAIEYKTTGKKATPKQSKEANKLKLASTPCRCCDNVQDAREFIDLMTQIAAQDDPFLDVAVVSNDTRSFNS